MKKYILIAFLFVFTASMGQIVPKVDGWVTKPKVAPGTPVDGEVYYDSTTKKTYQWDGTVWIEWGGIVDDSNFAKLDAQNVFNGTQNQFINGLFIGNLAGTGREIAMRPFTVSPTLTSFESAIFVDENNDFTYFKNTKKAWALTSNNVTTKRFYNLPDKDGTIAMLSDVAGFVTSVAGKTGAVTLVKADVGLANVDNTTDLSKPISTATQSALNGKLNLSGGTMSGAINLGGNNITSVGSIDASGSITTGSNLIVGNSVSFLPSGGLTTIAGRNETGFLTGNVFSWKQTDAEHEAQFNFNGLTADRVFTLPDTPGTFALTSQLGTANSVTSAMIVDGTIANADLDTATKSSLTKADGSAQKTTSNTWTNTNIFQSSTLFEGTTQWNKRTTPSNGAAYAEIYFRDDDSWGFESTEASSIYGFLDFKALTVNKPLVFTDTNVTWNGTSLTQGATATTTTYDNTSSGLSATNVQAAVDELIGTTPFQITANTTLTNSHLNRVLWSNSGTELDLTINSGVGVDGDIVYMMPYTANSVLRFFPGTATVLNTLKTAVTAGAELIYRKINGAWIGDPRDGVAYTTCTASPNEKALTANAASDPNCNEANSASGFTGNVGTIVPTSESSGQINGLYAIKGTINTGSTVGYLQYSYAITSGDTYTVSFKMKSTAANSSAGVTAWTNLSGGPASDYLTAGEKAAGTWVTRSYNVTATATGNAVLRFYAAAGATSNIGDNIWVDNLSIIKTN